MRPFVALVSSKQSTSRHSSRHIPRQTYHGSSPCSSHSCGLVAHSLVVSRIHMDPRPSSFACSILCVFSLCMLSVSNEYYQIFLSQGLGFGLGAGGIFTTCLVVAGQWFVQRRGLAVGIVTCGSSLGGVVFPFLVNRIIEEVGFAGAMRYTALFVGILLPVACFLVKARLARKEWNRDLKWFNLKLLMDRSFGLYTLGAFLVMWGLWAPFDYISTFALSADFTPALSIYLIAIIK